MDPPSVGPDQSVRIPGWQQRVTTWATDVGVRGPSPGWRPAGLLDAVSVPVRCGRSTSARQATSASGSTPTNRASPPCGSTPAGTDVKIRLSRPCGPPVLGTRLGMLGQHACVVGWTEVSIPRRARTQRRHHPASGYSALPQQQSHRPALAEYGHRTAVSAGRARSMRGSRVGKLPATSGTAPR